MSIKVSTIKRKPEDEKIFTIEDVIKLIPYIKKNNGEKLTDKAKILIILAMWDIPYEEKGNSLYFSGRRILFDEVIEDITSITDYQDKS